MATRTTQSYLRGFLVQDKRLQLWTAETNASEAGPEAGPAVPSTRDDNTRPALVLATSGDQTTGTTVTAVVAQGGELGDATLYFERDADTDAYGWNNNVHPSLYEPIEWSDSCRHPDCESTPDGGLHVVVYDPSDWEIRVYSRDPDTRAWSESLLYTADEDPSETLFPTIACDPWGGLWVWHWVNDPDAEVANVRAYVSRDYGATWSQVHQAALASQISTGASGYTLQRLRACFSDRGHVLLLGHLQPASGSPANDVLYQWAAESGGGALRTITEEFSGRGYPDVIWKDDAFWCFYLVYGDDGKPILRVIGSAFQSLDTAEAVDVREGLVLSEARITASAFVEAELAAVVTEEGTVYLYTHAYGGGAPSTVYGHVYRFRGTLDAPLGSQDNGWDAAGDGNAWTWHKAAPSGNTTEYPSNIAACAHRGRVFLAANPEVSSGGAGVYLIGYYLGGYDSIPRPSRYLSAYDPDRDPLEYGYIPLAVPGSLGWTATGGGTDTIVAGQLDVVTTGIETRYWDLTGSGADAGMVRAVLDVDSGGALATDNIIVALRVTDGANHYEAKVRALLSTTLQLRLINTAGGTIGSDVDTGTASPVEVMLAVAYDASATNAKVLFAWRAWSTSELTQWTLAELSVTPGAVGTTTLIRFGHGFAAAGHSIWRNLFWSWDHGPVTVTRLSRPGELPGAPIGTSPRYLADGVLVAGLDGAAVAGDEYAVEADHRYSLERLDPRRFPSPSEPWRATGTGAMNLSWDAVGTTENAYSFSDLWGVYLGRCNIKSAIVYYYDEDASPGTEWTSLGTLALSAGLSSLPFLRAGNTITPNPAGTFTNEPWRAAGELVGGTIDFGGGVYRKIAWNTEGYFSADTGKRRMVIELEGLTGSEPTSGTCDLWAPAGILVVNLLGKKARGFRLALPSQANADGYHEIGIAVLGPVHTFSRDMAHGTEERRAALYELAELANGYRQGRALGGTRRTLSLQLSDLHPTAEIEESDGRYVLGSDSSGALVLANYGDEWARLEGVLRYCDGGTVPFVYTPLIRVATSGALDTQVVNVERHVLYGRLVSELNREHAQGLPEEGVTWRGDPLIIEEEI